MNEQDDDVVEDSPGLGVVAGDHLINRFDQRLGAKHFTRVQPTVDPNNRFTFLRQLASLFLRNPLGLRQSR